MKRETYAIMMAYVCMYGWVRMCMCMRVSMYLCVFLMPTVDCKHDISKREACTSFTFDTLMYYDW